MKQILVLFLTFALCLLKVMGQNPLHHSVYFERDKAEISASEIQKLNKFLQSVSDTAAKIELIGHADYLGSEAYNLRLSENRAKTVGSFLENQRLVPVRIILSDFKGESESTQTPDPSGNPPDRKVEIVLQLQPKKSPAINELKPIAEEPSSETELLTRAEVGQTVVLRNLNFFPGMHYLVPEALPELERLAEVLKSNPNMEIEIQGHICCKLDSLDGLDISTRTYSLSFNRSKYIYDQLVLAGVEQDQMKYRGFAGSRPLIKPELTETDRLRNRRVEIRILKK
ncbi:MAG: OmpA family protein [Flavobacteriales bacterium]|nr:OmpA family protein [Flavobacteriales bacterium]